MNKVVLIQKRCFHPEQKSFFVACNTWSLTDPELTNSEKMHDQEKEYYLDPKEELFLLALCLEKPAHPNCEYVAHLATYYGTVVSTTFILRQPLERFVHHRMVSLLPAALPHMNSLAPDHIFTR
jgi:hypothetical protein